MTPRTKATHCKFPGCGKPRDPECKYVRCLEHDRLKKAEDARYRRKTMTEEQRLKRNEYYRDRGSRKTPEEKEAYRAWKREWYAANRERVLANRRERLGLEPRAEYLARVTKPKVFKPRPAKVTVPKVKPERTEGTIALPRVEKATVEKLYGWYEGAKR